MKVEQKNREITTEKQMMHLIRYIHNNPVKAKIVSKAKDWEFSDYSNWIGIRKSTLFNSHLLMRYFENHESYKKFFNDYKVSQKTTNELGDFFFDTNS